MFALIKDRNRTSQKVPIEIAKETKKMEVIIQKIPYYFYKTKQHKNDAPLGIYRIDFVLTMYV